VNITVQQIPPAEAIPWLTVRHYAKRACQIQWAFGAYRGNELIGVVTYGIPASRHLCMGLCGEEWADSVLELNRLCCESTRNVASMLVGRSLRMLPRPRIVVSYADTGQGHIGYVYQSTNFIYTGLTDSDRKTPKGDRVSGKGHSRHDGRLPDGSVDTTLEIVRRSQKHRYVIFLAAKRQRKELTALLKYPVAPYPKGESRRYDASGDIHTQLTLIG
jgi:hypothetical protein